MITELLATANQTLSPFEYVATHIQLVGWPVIVYAAWKARGFISAVMHRAVNVENQVNLAMSNHLPHIQASLERTEELIKAREDVMHSMDTSLKAMDANLRILAEKRRK